MSPISSSQRVAEAIVHPSGLDHIVSFTGQRTEWAVPHGPID